MNTKPSLDKIKAAMKDKEYRDAIIEEHVKAGLPFQVYGLRKKKGWTQKELGDRTSMAQERISLLEKPDYAKFSISTLLKLASAFDVGLTVRFVSFGKIFQEEMNLSDSLIPCDFNEDPMFQSPIGKQGHDDRIDSFDFPGETQNTRRQKNTMDFQPLRVFTQQANMPSMLGQKNKMDLHPLLPNARDSTEAIAVETFSQLKRMPSDYHACVGPKSEVVGSL